MRNLANEKIVIDNCVLSNFARADRLDLLLRFPCEIFTTREVYEENINSKDGNCSKETKNKLLKVLNLIDSNHILIKSASEMESLVLLADLQEIRPLGIGEISCMVLAREMDAIFVTDERRATNEAKRRGIKTLDTTEHKGTKLLLNHLLENKIISPEDYKEIQNYLSTNGFVF